MKSNSEDLELGVQDSLFYIGKAPLHEYHWGLCNFLFELQLWSFYFLLWFPWSKAKEETGSVKYLKRDIINNELLSNMEITLMKRGSRSTTYTSLS